MADAPLLQKQLLRRDVGCKTPLREGRRKSGLGEGELGCDVGPTEACGAHTRLPFKWL